MDTTELEAIGLSAAHYNNLSKGSAISDDIIQERGYKTVTGREDFTKLDNGIMSKKQLEFISYPALAIPYHDLGRTDKVVWVARPDAPRAPKGSIMKYVCPGGIPNILDVLPSFQEDLRNPKKILFFTEGAKKADAIVSHFPDAVAINLNGVHGWVTRSKDGGKVFNQEIYDLALNDRKVVLAFDSDWQSKPQVRQALTMLANKVASREAIVETLDLPNDPEHKLGIDDALAEGWSVEKIMTHIHPWLGEAKRGGTKLFVGFTKEYFVPSNYEYDVKNARLSIQRSDKWVPIYNGLIAVESIGVDLSTKQEVMKVAFEGSDGKPQHVTAPRIELNRARGILDTLGARGANVHDGNAKDIAVFLTELAYRNRDVIPYSQHTSELGLIGEGLITPAGSIGFEQPVSYDGEHLVANSDNLDAERGVFEKAKDWQGAYPFWLARAMAMASPFMAKMGLVRNPVIGFIGESNGGKTTSINSAMSVWGDPSKKPFRITASSTLVGFSERVRESHGLPILIDEVHNHQKPEILVSQIYDYANKDSRTKGKRTGGATGGESVGGLLLLAGEAQFSFVHRGIMNRVLTVDTNRTPPLGNEATSGSKIGQERANFLDDAWKEGSGAFGLKMAEKILGDWDEFVDSCKGVESALNVKCDSAWKRAFAIAGTTLLLMFEELDVEIPDNFLQDNLNAWVDMLTNGRDTSNPAMEAWSDVASIFSRGLLHDQATWKIIELHNEAVAFQKIGDDFWRVPTPRNSPIFKDGIVKKHGREWVRQGLVVGDANGNPTQSLGVKGGYTQQCLKINDSVIKGDE